MANTYSTAVALASSQYWDIADASQTGLDITSDLTISVWFNLASNVPTSEEYTLVAKWDDSSQQAYNLRLRDQAGTDQVRFSVHDGTTDDSYNQNYTHPSTGTWTHMVVTWDASASTAEFFVNGSSIGSQSGSRTSIRNSTASFKIGAATNGGAATRFFDGKLDDVRIWSRILSSTEIGNLYSDPCNFSNGASLQGEWLFENNGNDESSNANNLTNNNSATFSTDVPYVCAAGGATPTPQLLTLGVG